MVAPVVAPPVDPPVEAPEEAPIDDETIAWRLHEELHDGEDYDEEAVAHQTHVFRMLAAVSVNSTKQVVRLLDRQRANEVKDLVNVFNVAYSAVSTDNLMETEAATVKLHRRMANHLVGIARSLVDTTTRQMVRNGARMDVHEEIYSTLIEDAMYLRDNTLGRWVNGPLAVAWIKT